MLYLTHCRMPLAAARLAAGAATVSAVSSAVGYESEAAFCRAFKKVTGSPRHLGAVDAMRTSEPRFCALQRIPRRLSPSRSRLWGIFFRTTAGLHATWLVIRRRRSRIPDPAVSGNRSSFPWASRRDTARPGGFAPFWLPIGCKYL